MNSAGEKIGAVVAAIIGVAVLAIVVSAQANTVNVLSAFFGGVANLIAVAISPITGQTVQGSTAGLAGGSWLTGSGVSGFSVNAGGITGAINGLLGGASGAGNVISGLTGSGGSGMLSGQDFLDAGSFGN